MNPKDVHILLVDDERDILEILDYNLSKEGFRTTLAVNGKEALKKARREPPNLIVLDVMMPEMDGFETCMRLRGMPELNDTIITFLTARAEDDMQMEGLHLGADDYITKPVKPKVFVSKIKALLRRLKSDDADTIISLGNLTIDRSAHKVTFKGHKCHLPRKEFELLALLASNPNKVFTREKILASVWGNDVVVGNRTIDVHIRKLREKIDNGKFETIKGIGYKYVD